MNLFRSKNDNFTNHKFSEHAFLLISLVLMGFGLSPRAQAKTGPPVNCNTSEGYQALINITTGVNDTAFGCGALFADTTGTDNTATGSAALGDNTTGSQNTATGSLALRNNNADNNTADGFKALLANTGGTENTAVGSQALYSNRGGDENTAIGRQALFSNTGGFNTSEEHNGFFGDGNTAVGWQALFSLNGTLGGAARGNTGIGYGALGGLTTGAGNIALGVLAGEFVTTGNGNIDIGHPGVAGDDKTIRIGSTLSFGAGTGFQTRTFIAAIREVATDNDDAVPVVIDSAGQLGTTSSSARFKTEIEPMDKASEAVLALKPVTFHYNSNAKGRPQFGLIAEDVEKVNPDLVVRDAKGQIYTVRYEAVNAMLLNEFLKEHRKVEQLKSIVAKQEAIIVKQQKGMEAIVAHLKEQDSKIQKVSDQLEVNNPAPQMVLNR